MKNLKSKSNIVIYQAKSGAIELKADISRETIWANLNQIAELFGVQKSAISKHVKNIFETGELSAKATVSKMETVQKEGNREVLRVIEVYNLDMIVAIGYRVNSKNATQFRIWATKVLKEFLTKGFVLNKKQIQKNYKEFLKNVESIQNLLPEHVALDPKAILELIKEFSSTWISLDAYDKEKLKPMGSTRKAIKLGSEELLRDIGLLRGELIARGEASDIFAQERESGSINGIIGNVMQSFGGKEVYETLEEKAAHVLYFMVKNHPFIDGNKRSGAFAFIWFLKKAKIKTASRINPNALTALTLLIAESDPKKKDLMVGLVVQMLK
ncbi:MAG: RhuM family protein [Candidatus Paceibacterota bacterium]